MLNKYEKESVLSLIDRGGWKHSWHLNKNKYGYTDWWDKKNLQDCLDLAKRAHEEALGLTRLAERCKTVLYATISEIEDDEKAAIAEENENEN